MSALTYVMIGLLVVLPSVAFGQAATPSEPSAVRVAILPFASHPDTPAMHALVERATARLQKTLRLDRRVTVVSADPALRPRGPSGRPLGVTYFVVGALGSIEREMGMFTFGDEAGRQRAEVWAAILRRYRQRPVTRQMMAAVLQSYQDRPCQEVMECLRLACPC